jgi:hypothetical protein
MSSYLVTISKDVVRDTQMLRILGNKEKYINEDDTSILEEAAEETNMGRGDGDIDWCDVQADIVLKSIATTQEQQRN